MLRILILCLALTTAGAAAAQRCDYRQPPPSEAMAEAEKMRKEGSAPFALIMAMREITKKEPDNALAWRWRGEAEAAGGDLRSGLEATTKAIDLDPCNLATRVARAAIAERKGELRLAYGDYTAILAQQPRNATFLRMRGDLLMGAAEFTAAVTDYDAALATGSEDEDLLLNHGGMMQELGRFKDAIADYNRILARDKDNVEALVARGYSQFMLADFAAAEPDLATGATLNANAAAWTFLARARLGKADAARAFVEATQKLPRQSWIGLVAELLEAGAADDRIFASAGEDAERRCTIFFYLGELALAKDDKARAKSMFEKGADACPKDPVRTNGSLREYVAMTEELKRMK